MLAEFGGACALKTADVPCEFNYSHLHAEAKSEIGLLVLSCVADCFYLALDTAVAEAAGYYNAVNAAEKLLSRFGGDFLGVDELDRKSVV